MADVNAWHRTLERRTLEALRGEVHTLRAAARDKSVDGYGQRRAFSRVLTLIDLKLSHLGDDEARERAERADSQSADDIDEGLKA